MRQPRVAASPARPAARDLTPSSLEERVAERRTHVLIAMSNPMFLTLNEVVERYRDQISEGTLRNWRSMRIGPSFIKIGKGVLYPLEGLDRWDRRTLFVC